MDGWDGCVKKIEYIPAALTKMSTSPDFRSWKTLRMSSLFKRSHWKYLRSRLLLWKKWENITQRNVLNCL